MTSEEYILKTKQMEQFLPFLDDFLSGNLEFDMRRKFRKVRAIILKEDIVSRELLLKCEQYMNAVVKTYANSTEIPDTKATSNATPKVIHEAEPTNKENIEKASNISEDLSAAIEDRTDSTDDLSDDTVEESFTPPLSSVEASCESSETSDTATSDEDDRRKNSTNNHRKPHSVVIKTERYREQDSRRIHERRGIPATTEVNRSDQKPQRQYERNNGSKRFCLVKPEKLYTCIIPRCRFNLNCKSAFVKHLKKFHWLRKDRSKCPHCNFELHMRITYRLVRYFLNHLENHNLHPQSSRSIEFRNFKSESSQVGETSSGRQHAKDYRQRLTAASARKTLDKPKSRHSPEVIPLQSCAKMVSSEILPKLEKSETDQRTSTQRFAVKSKETAVKAECKADADSRAKLALALPIKKSPHLTQGWVKNEFERNSRTDYCSPNVSESSLHLKTPSKRSNADYSLDKIPKKCLALFCKEKEATKLVDPKLETVPCKATVRKSPIVAHTKLRPEEESAEKAQIMTKFRSTLDSHHADALTPVEDSLTIESYNNNENSELSKLTVDECCSICVKIMLDRFNPSFRLTLEQKYKKLKMSSSCECLPNIESHQPVKSLRLGVELDKIPAELQSSLQKTAAFQTLETAVTVAPLIDEAVARVNSTISNPLPLEPQVVDMILPSLVTSLSSSTKEPLAKDDVPSGAILDVSETDHTKDHVPCEASAPEVLTPLCSISTDCSMPNMDKKISSNLDSPIDHSPFAKTLPNEAERAPRVVFKIPSKPVPILRKRAYSIDTNVVKMNQHGSKVPRTTKPGLDHNTDCRTFGTEGGPMEQQLIQCRSRLPIEMMETSVTDALASVDNANCNPLASEQPVVDTNLPHTPYTDNMSSGNVESQIDQPSVPNTDRSRDSSESTPRPELLAEKSGTGHSTSETTEIVPPSDGPEPNTVYTEATKSRASLSQRRIATESDIDYNVSQSGPPANTHRSEGPASNLTHSTDQNQNSASLGTNYDDQSTNKTSTQNGQTACSPAGGSMGQENSEFLISFMQFIRARKSSKNAARCERFGMDQASNNKNQSESQSSARSLQNIVGSTNLAPSKSSQIPTPHEPYQSVGTNHHYWSNRTSSSPQNMITIDLTGQSTGHVHRTESGVAAENTLPSVQLPAVPKLRRKMMHRTLSVDTSRTYQQYLAANSSLAKTTLNPIFQPNFQWHYTSQQYGPNFVGQTAPLSQTQPVPSSSYAMSMSGVPNTVYYTPQSTPYTYATNPCFTEAAQGQTPFGTDAMTSMSQPHFGVATNPCYTTATQSQTPFGTDAMTSMSPHFGEACQADQQNLTGSTFGSAEMLGHELQSSTQPHKSSFRPVKRTCRTLSVDTLGRQHLLAYNSSNSSGQTTSDPVIRQSYPFQQYCPNNVRQQATVFPSNASSEDLTSLGSDAADEALQAIYTTGSAQTNRGNFLSSETLGQAQPLRPQPRKINLQRTLSIDTTKTYRSHLMANHSSGSDQTTSVPYGNYELQHNGPKLVGQPAPTHQLPQFNPPHVISTFQSTDNPLSTSYPTQWCSSVDRNIQATTTYTAPITYTAPATYTAPVTYTAPTTYTALQHIPTARSAATSQTNQGGFSSTGTLGQESVSSQQQRKRTMVRTFSVDTARTLQPSGQITADSLMRQNISSQSQRNSGNRVGQAVPMAEMCQVSNNSSQPTSIPIVQGNYGPTLVGPAPTHQLPPFNTLRPMLPFPSTPTSVHHTPLSTPCATHSSPTVDRNIQAPTQKFGEAPTNHPALQSITTTRYAVTSQTNQGGFPSTGTLGQESVHSQPHSKRTMIRTFSVDTATTLHRSGRITADLSMREDIPSVGQAVPMAEKGHVPAMTNVFPQDQQLNKSSTPSSGHASGPLSTQSSQSDQLLFVTPQSLPPYGQQKPLSLYLVCLECGELKTTYLSLCSHFNQKHEHSLVHFSIERKFLCAYCYTIASFSDLKRHHKDEHGRRAFVVRTQSRKSTCGECQERLTSTEYLKKHNETFHAKLIDKAELSCSYMTRSFFEDLLQIGHSRRSTGLSKCPYCDYFFLTLTACGEHIRQSHPTKKFKGAKFAKCSDNLVFHGCPKCRVLV